MNNVKSTKRAFLSSVLATILCFAMLLGTTFAWFTDKVESGNNIITAGNLDIKLTHADKGTQGVSVEVDGETKLFDDVALWEPGAMAWEKFTISNEGTLDLKYLFTLNANNATEVNGISFAEMLKVAVVDADFKYTREEVASITEWKSLETFSLPGTLNDQESYTFGIVIWWQPSENDNIFNIADKVEVSVGVTLVATQLVSEEDGFDSSYDKGAPWMGGVDTAWYFENPEATEFVIDTAEELAGLAALVNGTATAPVATFAADGKAETVHVDFAGKTVKLGADIDLYDIPWTPIGRIGQTSTDFTFAFKGTFDGQDHTISNLDVNMHGWAGVFGIAYKAQINNVNIENVSIRANRMAGALVGQLYGSIDNCHVENADIMVTPNAVGTSFDNGDKVGGIVGWIGDNGNNRTLTNCSATNVELGAYRDVGGIAGYVASSTTISNNKVDELTITVDQTTNHYGYKDPNANEIFGRTGGEVIEKDNTVGEEIAVNSTVSQNGLTIKIDGVTDETVLYLVPEDYEGATVTVPDGVTAIGNYAFSLNTNVETVVLSSTVRDLGRGFDSSTVKKVVLNEGLEEISSRAFRSTTALEEVVISSTVTEIADNAFQKSSIKKITIPANVETIGETSFGASLIESVVFEGNTEIQGYAFRGCTNLRTVYLLGDDVKFVASTLNGRNSMWFCNGESNNPGTSNITFYVANETVAARVKTAMGAEANNTPVHVVKFIYTVEELTDACANGGAYLLMADLTLADGVKVVVNSEMTLDLNGKTITGKDTTSTSFALFDIQPGKKLTINDGIGTGVITLSATIDSDWNRYSSVISNQRATLIVNGGTIKHTGGTDMAYAIDTLTNTGAETAQTVINGGSIESTYIGIRQYCNSTSGLDELVVNGGTITGVRRSVWMQNPNSYKNLGKLTINGGTLLGEITVDAETFDVAVKGGNFTDLADALLYAVDDAKIVMAADFTGDVTITQKEGVNITLDGNGKTFNGVMTVFGDGRQNGAETLTIQNIHFVAKEGANSCIVSPDRTLNNKYSYAHNVTVKNCTFTDPDGVVGCAAIRHEDGGDKNWTIIGCTVDATMHSLIQTNNVEGKLIINGCTVESKNGANLNSCTNVEIDGCTFDVKGYAVRFGVGSGGNLGVAKTFEIKNSTLKSECNDGDAIIIFRASAVDAVLNINDTTLTGKTQFAGQTAKTVIKIDGAQISAFVGTAEDLLEALSSLKTTGAVVLNCDIDLTGVLWDVTMPWTGSNTTITIDGQGHTIKGLTTQGERGGLLGKLSTNGNVVIKNLKFEDVTITGTGTDSECAGGALIGWYENHGGTAIIENVHVTNVTASNFKYSGGLIGYTSTDGLEIRDCSVNGGKIESINHVGGLVGYLSNAAANTTSTVKNCSLEALEVKTVNSTKNREGAVVGTMQAGCAIDSVTIKNVTVMGAAATIEKVVGVVNLGTVTNITIQ